MSRFYNYPVCSLGKSRRASLLHVRVCMYVCVEVCIYAYMYVCVHLCIYIYIYIYIYIDVLIYTRGLLCMCIRVTIQHAGRHVLHLWCAVYRCSNIVHDYGAGEVIQNVFQQPSKGLFYSAMHLYRVTRMYIYWKSVDNNIKISQFLFLQFTITKHKISAIRQRTKPRSNNLGN